ncbi:L-pipecolate dehydrogenase [Pseudomonas paraeruginosa]|nr:L-pipecolate dehydrogenase [Pseudomonas aeruginosa]
MHGTGNAPDPDSAPNCMKSRNDVANKGRLSLPGKPTTTGGNGQPGEPPP